MQNQLKTKGKMTPAVHEVIDRLLSQKDGASVSAFYVALVSSKLPKANAEGPKAKVIETPLLSNLDEEPLEGPRQVEPSAEAQVSRKPAGSRLKIDDEEPL
jgi:hypothetical protein